MNITHYYRPFVPPTDPFGENSAENERTRYRRDAFRAWILQVCKGENRVMPEGTIILWFDSKPIQVYSGKWTIDDTYVYVGQTNQHAKIPPGWAPAIMWAIAHYWGLVDEPEIVNALSSFTAMVVLKTYRMARTAATIGATTDGDPLVVFAVKGEQLATYVNNKWYLSTGEEVIVDAKWITFGLTDEQRPTRLNPADNETETAETPGERVEGEQVGEVSEEVGEGEGDEGGNDRIEDVDDEYITGDELHDGDPDVEVRPGTPVEGGDAAGDEALGTEPLHEVLHQPAGEVSAM